MQIDFAKNPIGSLEFGLDEIKQVSATVGASLVENKLRFVGLKGDLGAGKTTFVGSLLKSWGFDSSLPVPSPTFTCVQEYELKVGAVAHCDFYRIDNPVLETQELLDHREFAFVLAEWPKQLVEAGELDLLLEFAPAGKASEFDRRRLSWQVFS